MDAEIIVELFSRIKALERDVAELKQKLSGTESASGISDETLYGKIVSPKPLIPDPERKRDTTRYSFDGVVYSKKGLVYAVVKRYVAEHPEITRAELKRVFDRSLQGSLGVVENVEIAKQRGDAEFRVRFFANEDEILHLVDGDMVVCTQWGILNIPRFLIVAERLGYQINAIL